MCLLVCLRKPSLIGGGHGYIMSAMVTIDLFKILQGPTMQILLSFTCYLSCCQPQEYCRVSDIYCIVHNSGRVNRSFQSFGEQNIGKINPLNL